MPRASPAAPVTVIIVHPPSVRPRTPHPEPRAFERPAWHQSNPSREDARRLGADPGRRPCQSAVLLFPHQPRSFVSPALRRRSWDGHRRRLSETLLEKAPGVISKSSRRAAAVGNFWRRSSGPAREYLGTGGSATAIAPSRLWPTRIRVMRAPAPSSASAHRPIRDIDFGS